MSHTPGPWVSWNSFGGMILKNWRIGERNSTKGVIRPIAEIAGDDFLSGDQQVANANLIAAAPELLEACEAALRALNIAPRFRVTITNHAVESSYDVAAMLGSVILKAKGEPS